MEVENGCKSPIPALTIPDWALNCELSPEILEKIGAGEESNNENDDEK